MSFGTTTMSISWKGDYVACVADGKGMDPETKFVSDFNMGKLLVVNNKFIVSLTGLYARCVSMVEQLNTLLQNGESVDNACSRLGEGVQKWKNEHGKCYPSVIGVSGFWRKRRFHRFVGPKNYFDSLVLDKNSVGVLYISGSGTDVARNHFEKLVSKVSFTTSDDVQEAVIEALCAACIETGNTGGYIQIADLKKGEEPEFYLDKLHFLRHSLDHFEHLQCYFENKIMVVTKNLLYSPKTERNFFKMFKDRLTQVESFNTLGFKASTKETVRLAVFPRLVDLKQVWEGVLPRGADDETVYQVDFKSYQMYLLKPSRHNLEKFKHFSFDKEYHDAAIQFPRF